jgi:hypothetical protein
MKGEVKLQKGREKQQLPRLYFSVWEKNGEGLANILNKG